MLGLAAGDALGTTLEFAAPGTFEPIGDMGGGGPFRLQAGEWTDDTSMALCLAESLVACGGFDAAEQMNRYRRWREEGYLSSTGECFDIGNTVAAALDRYIEDGDPYAGSTHPHRAGNGSLMRLAPIPLAFRHDPDQAIECAGLMSRTTHGAPEAVDACRYYAGLIVGALQGTSKAELMHPLFHPALGQWPAGSLSPAIEEVARGSFSQRTPPEIRGTGYVVASLEAALWAFTTTENFRTGALAAVNLGDDADTTGAVFGQLAGAYYGAGGVPEGWRAKLCMGAKITELADGLFGLALEIRAGGGSR